MRRQKTYLQKLNRSKEVRSVSSACKNDTGTPTSLAQLCKQLEERIIQKSQRYSVSHEDRQSLAAALNSELGLIWQNLKTPSVDTTLTQAEKLQLHRQTFSEVLHICEQLFLQSLHLMETLRRRGVFSVHVNRDRVAAQLAIDCTSLLNVRSIRCRIVNGIKAARRHNQSPATNALHNSERSMTATPWEKAVEDDLREECHSMPDLQRETLLEELEITLLNRPPTPLVPLSTHPTSSLEKCISPREDLKRLLQESVYKDDGNCETDLCSLIESLTCYSSSRLQRLKQKLQKMMEEEEETKKHKVLVEKPPHPQGDVVSVAFYPQTIMRTAAARLSDRIFPETIKLSMCPPVYNDLTKESEEEEGEGSVAGFLDEEQMQHRLERVWNALFLPEGQRLDMAIKYSSQEHRDHLQKAIAAWEQAARLIQKRELLLSRLEDFERKASDPNRFFQRGYHGSSIARLEEASQREKLNSQISVVDQELSKTMGHITTRFSDNISYKGRPYREKMRWDRTEMLYWLQQERRVQSLEMFVDGRMALPARLPPLRQSQEIHSGSHQIIQKQPLSHCEGSVQLLQHCKL
ncbi:coiled-coil domain-containing 87-like protein [Labeo rohita]|uniref:Coiled-coil domain-containing 87-like protein n=1 Tax=Labeo rohita TaxID=84645 RepID=A0A498MIY6_LABRO|nr:coiled-coil domain-containing 87-like protein [Labeo rohita]RXN19743.1 coiled-coil domain-containing 87-like protein [Labeo rohita]